MRKSRPLSNVSPSLATQTVQSDGKPATPLQKNHSRDVLKYKLRNGADDVELARERNNSRDENAKKVSPCRGVIRQKNLVCDDGTLSGFFSASE